MNTTVENILALIAGIPAVYGFICWIRRSLNASSAAAWVKKTYPDEWNGLHWLARRNPGAGIQVLVAKGLISGPEVDEFRARDEYLEKATWIGLLVTAVLLLVIAVWKYLL